LINEVEIAGVEITGVEIAEAAPGWGFMAKSSL
jgi:hypothetical protein